MSRNKKFYVLGVLIFLVVIFAWCEIVVRIFYKNLDIDEVTGRKETILTSDWAVTDAFSAYKGRAGYKYFKDRTKYNYVKKWTDDSYEKKNLSKSINNYGFISTPDIEIDKPSDTIRIVFLGESSTAGTGFNLSDEETWPWQTVERLRQRFPKRKFDFLNGSFGGYTTFESFGRLWSRIRFFKPDIILVNHGWNDMYYFNKHTVDDIVRWKEDKDGGWQYNKPKFYTVIKPKWTDKFIRYSQFLIRLRLRLERKDQGEAGVLAQAKPLANNFDRRGLGIYRGNLKLIQAAAKSIQAELFVLKQPTLIVPGLSAEERKRCGYIAHGFDHDAHVAAYEGIYQIIDDEIHPSHIIDMRAMSGTHELFFDHIHPTYPYGVNKYAELVSDHITKWISKNK